MSKLGQTCKTCARYDEGGCSYTGDCFASHRQGWTPRADAPAAAQAPARAPNGEQPAPTPNDNPAAWNLVMRDMLARDALGQQKYGVRLQPGNGRDTLRDAYEEALDLAVYLRTAIFERDGQ